MKTVNIHEAKSNLSRLLHEVQQGRPFLIAKADKPIARVTSIEETGPGQTRRLGFLAGQIEVPEDFDRMAQAEILPLFGERKASTT